MKKILVTGGAGYIGSHTCKLLSECGFLPLVFDNLIYGHRDAVRWGPLIEGPLADERALAQIFTEHEIEAVIHFAALTYVGESIHRPDLYYRNNLVGSLNLFDAMRRAGVKSLVFSSTCATYGVPSEVPIGESHPQAPINPYGASKLWVERVLADYGRAYGLRSLSLRYFNACGASPAGELGEDHEPETHLIPLILDVALGRRKEVTIYGDDYPTRDGTCIRDYVHVDDLARAHLLALRRLIDFNPAGFSAEKNAADAYNVGSGSGFTVREMIAAVERVTRRPVPVRIAPRRSGDPPALIADSSRIRAELGWVPHYSEPDAMIETAWRWHRSRFAPRTVGTSRP